MKNKVIINGCFDCLHEGHRHLIKTALKLADKGIVYILVNTDRSVRELKGTDRPINKLEDRIAAIENSYHMKLNKYTGESTVRFIAFDSECQLLKLINYIEPTMIIKGNDRPDVRKIVGSDRWPVLIIPRLTDSNGRDISTTNILDKSTK